MYICYTTITVDKLVQFANHSRKPQSQIKSIKIPVVIKHRNSLNMQNNGNRGKKGALRSMLGKQTGNWHISVFDGNTDPLFPQETIQLINLTNGLCEKDLLNCI